MVNVIVHTSETKYDLVTLITDRLRKFDIEWYWKESSSIPGFWDLIYQFPAHKFFYSLTDLQSVLDPSAYFAAVRKFDTMAQKLCFYTTVEKCNESVLLIDDVYRLSNGALNLTYEPVTDFPDHVMWLLTGQKFLSFLSVLQDAAPWRMLPKAIRLQIEKKVTSEFERLVEEALPETALSIPAVYAGQPTEVRYIYDKKFTVTRLINNEFIFNALEPKDDFNLHGQLFTLIVGQDSVFRKVDSDLPNMSAGSDGSKFFIEIVDYGNDIRLSTLKSKLEDSGKFHISKLTDPFSEFPGSVIKISCDEETFLDGPNFLSAVQGTPLESMRGQLVEAYIASKLAFEYGVGALENVSVKQDKDPNDSPEDESFNISYSVKPDLLSEEQLQHILFQGTGAVFEKEWCSYHQSNYSFLFPTTNRLLKEQSEPLEEPMDHHENKVTFAAPPSIAPIVVSPPSSIMGSVFESFEAGAETYVAQIALNMAETWVQDRLLQSLKQGAVRKLLMSRPFRNTRMARRMIETEMLRITNSFQYLLVKSVCLAGAAKLIENISYLESDTRDKLCGFLSTANRLQWEPWIAQNAPTAIKAIEGIVSELTKVGTVKDIPEISLTGE